MDVNPRIMGSLNHQGAMTQLFYKARCILISCVNRKSKCVERNKRFSMADDDCLSALNSFHINPEVFSAINSNMFRFQSI